MLVLRCGCCREWCWRRTKCHKSRNVLILQKFDVQTHIYESSESHQMNSVMDIWCILLHCTLYYRHIRQKYNYIVQSLRIYCVLSQRHIQQIAMLHTNKLMTLLIGWSCALHSALVTWPVAATHHIFERLRFTATIVDSSATLWRYFSNLPTNRFDKPETSCWLTGDSKA